MASDGASAVFTLATIRISRLYHLALLGIWIFLVPAWPLLFYPVFHATLLIWDLPSAVRWRADWSSRLPMRSRAVAICLSGFLVLAVTWGELGVLHRLWPRPSHDALVSSWEVGLFGGHLSSTWSAAMPARWFSELMFGIYASYYLLAFLPLTVAGFARPEAEASDFRFRMLSTYLLLFLVYLVFPVFGPASLPSLIPVVLPGGYMAGFTAGLRSHGDSLGTAFPSSHVAGSVAMAIGVWHWWGRRWGVAWLAGALLVGLATVYTGNHFVVDAISGALVGGVLQWEPVRRVFLPRDLGQSIPNHGGYSS
jgi:membrane-associated phospholipid phosphatase